MTGTDPGRSFPRRLREAVGDVVALVYLALCAGLLVWALVVTAGDGSGESMAGVIPLLATAPASLVLLVLPDGAAMLVLAVVVGALVNATVIGLCARALRRGNRPDPAP
ncbi:MULTISPECIES: SCO4225 family membrane protein [unclassified Streptomyces]|uniref:SCO4225 family membrane protein n=1 Tax=unclassified Streptomyces TaxID=2593676 RepID=UPI0032564CAA